MSVQGGLLDAIDEEPQPFTLTSESPTIFELFIDEIEAVYGASGTSSWISIMRMYPSQAKYVYTKEYYDADVEYWGKQVTLGDITVAALATLLGVVPCVLIQGLGIAAEYIIPHGSSFQLYLCTAFFERVCMVGTSLSNMDGPYYRASAELKHIGILDPENLYQAIVTMDPTPHYTFYDPSESVFSSVDELARLTKLSYEAST